MRRGIAAAVAFALLLTGCNGSGGTSQASPTAGGAPFSEFVDTYFRAYFEFYPSEATSAGIHEYDAKLEDFTANRMRNRSSELRGQLLMLDEIRKRKISTDEGIDAAILDGRIRAELLDIDTIRWWRKNAIPYVSAPGQAADLLMKRNFAPPAERLRLMIDRMAGMDRLLGSMRDNVTDAPKEFTELAHRICTGSVGFFRNEVTAWAREAAGNDDTLFGQFQAVNRKVTMAFEITAIFLADQVPLSTGSFAIGPATFAKKLQYEEMMDTPLDRLLAIGEAQLDKDYKEFLATAQRIQPGAAASATMSKLSTEHPSEADLVKFARATLERIRQFVVEKKIIAIPSEVRPTILETPPYARAGSFASMDTPGAFETAAKEAYYYVTPPEKNWTPAHKQEHLRLFNKPVMDIITIHEAFPGHYTQFLYAKEFPTKTRKLTSTASNAEGWAHYAEQMMVEQGFGGGDPKIKLAQLSEALLRDCRFVAGIRMHTRGETVEQSARLFVDRGFQEPANAYEEARRGAYDPTYLYYTAGKLEIYKLREDYKRERGSGYSLEKFHTEFIRQGSIPIKLVRQLLLKNAHAPAL